VKPHHVVIILLGIICLAGSVSAALPGDMNGNDQVERTELAAIILDALHDGNAMQDARDAAYVYTFWNGTAKSITDSSGKERVIYRPFRRVVVMNSETLETMRSLGYNTSQVVGVDKYTLQKNTFFPEFTSTAGIGSIWAPDYEKIISLQPDAVFLYATVSKSSCDEIEATLARSSPTITVFRFDGYLPESYLKEIEVLSNLLDRPEQGKEFSEFYARNINTVTNRAAVIPEADRVRVYFETWTDYKSCAAGSGYDQKIGMAGGSNIFSSEPAEYPEIDPEAVLERSPQVIIKLIGSGRYNFGGYEGGNETAYQQAYRDMTSRKGWETLEAVRENRTYLLHTDILGGPQHFIGVQYMAKWFYPDRFTDLDPSAVHDEYLSRYQGLQPTLTNGLIFVYPS
jgi:iron complex transport system substrate-binding protein